MNILFKCKTREELLYKWFTIRLNNNIPRRELKTLISWILNEGDRKLIAAELKVSGNTLNVYLHALKIKKILLNSNGRYILNPGLQVPTTSKANINFIFNIDDTSNNS